MVDNETYYEVHCETSETTDSKNPTFNDILIDISRKYPLAIPLASGLITGVIVYAACTSVISTGVFRGNLRTINYLKRHPEILYKMV